jgi:hypothetical protein
MRLDLGTCIAPRNHRGSCQYKFGEGMISIDVERGPSPMDMVEDIKRARRNLKRGLLVIAVCAVLQVCSLLFLLTRLILGT